MSYLKIFLVAVPAAITIGAFLGYGPAFPVRGGGRVLLRMAMMIAAATAIGIVLGTVFLIHMTHSAKWALFAAACAAFGQALYLLDRWIAARYSRRP